MDVAAHVESQGPGGEGGGGGPRAGSDTGEERGAAADGAWARGEDPRGARGQPRGSRPGAVGGADPRLSRSPHPHRGADRGDGRRPPARGGAARSRRRDRRGLAATERRRDRAGSRPPRRHRLHLRVPPQRHRGCRRALPQVRQCGAAARRQRGARVQHDHRADPGQGGREGGPAGRRHPVRRHARPRRRHGDAHARSLPRPHHSSGRGGVRAVGRGARDGARPQARQGALPRLRRRGRRSRHGAGHRR